MYFPVAAFSGFLQARGISPSSGAGIMRVSVAEDIQRDVFPEA